MSEQASDTATVDECRSCCDCGKAFTFTRGEQVFYAKRGLQAPRRCTACRVTRKARYTTYAGWSDSAASRKREEFHGVCSACGQDARVPFEPQPDRPVYCSACFEVRMASNRLSR